MIITEFYVIFQRFLPLKNLIINTIFVSHFLFGLIFQLYQRLGSRVCGGRISNL